jgi:hypothetical protein
MLGFCGLQITAHLFELSTEIRISSHGHWKSCAEARIFVTVNRESMVGSVNRERI